MSPEQPRMKFRPNFIASLVLASIVGCLDAGAAEHPQIQFVAGDVQVVHADGSADPAKKGDLLKPGDRLRAGEHAMAQVRAREQGVVALRANSEIELKPVGDTFDVALNRGQVRTVSELAGKPSGSLRVVTADSKISVGAGDIETGLVSGAEGNSTVSRVHTGVVNVEGATAKPQGAFKKAPVSNASFRLPFTSNWSTKLPPGPEKVTKTSLPTACML